MPTCLPNKKFDKLSEKIQLRPAKSIKQIYDLVFFSSLQILNQMTFNVNEQYPSFGIVYKDMSDILKSTGLYPEMILTCLCR